MLKSVLGALVCVLGAFACTYMPYSGQRYASRTETVTVNGAYTSPNRSVSFQVCTNSSSFCNGSTSAYTVIATGKTASSSSMTDNHGTKWYAYSASFVVPTARWRSLSTGGYRANVRAVVDGLEAMTYRNPVGDCPEEYGSDQMQGTPSCAVASNAPADGVANTHGWIQIYAD